MSFTDMMSSARGPGVIGTILGLMVLLGFSLLFLLAFDDGLQGTDQTVESLIRDQTREIDSLASRVEAGAARLEDEARRKQLLEQMKELKSRSVKQRAEIEWLEERVNSIAGEPESTRREIEAYKDRYREHVRTKAKGTRIEQLTTAKGEVFEQVTIRQVNAVGIQIAHQSGFKRIPFEELPEEMKDYYQFCPVQKKQALASEFENRAIHERQVAAATDAVKQKQQNNAQREQAIARERNIQLLQRTEARIRSLDNEMRDLRRAIDLEARKTISRAPQMRLELANKEREKTTLEAQSIRLRAGQ